MLYCPKARLSRYNIMSKGRFCGLYFIGEASEQVMNYFSLAKTTCFVVENFVNNSLLTSIFASNQAILSHRKSNSDLFKDFLNPNNL